jgi:anti-anti-sigma factor
MVSSAIYDPPSACENKLADCLSMKGTVAMLQQLEEPIRLRCGCPICGNPLPEHLVFGLHDKFCSRCGNVLWCGKSMVEDIVVLSVFPDAAPESAELEALVTSLGRKAGRPRVIVDLSALDVGTSSLLAVLVFLQRRVDALQGCVVLCGVGELLGQILARTRIDTLFDIYATASEALYGLRLETPCGESDHDHFGLPRQSSYDLAADEEDTGCWEDTHRIV